MNAAVAQKPYEVPNGGLASFLTATTGDWSDEALNGLEYEIIRPTADQLADFGREGDNRIAHVADGETVIPMEVFQEDPALKEALFGRMREMGIDPERYVVGNQLNSINPVTGQPEFFLKKLFKGVKKAVKGVVKVFKKLAPVILSVGLGILFPPLGAIASGALGSGIGTLIQGGNLKDAFKAALIGGAVGGISSGIGSVMQGGEFMAGVKSGLPTGLGGGVNPSIAPTALTAAEQAKVAALESSGRITEGTAAVDLTGAEALGPEIMPPQNAAQAAVQESMQPAKVSPTDQLIRNKLKQNAIDAGSVAAETVEQASMSPTDQLIRNKLRQNAIDAGAAPTAPGAAPTAPTGGIPIEGIGDITQAARAAVDPGFFNSVKSFFTTGDISHLRQAFLPGSSATDILEKLKTAGFNVSTEQAAEIAKELAPGLMRKTLPLLGATTVLGGPLGLFKAEDPPVPFDAFGGMTGRDLLQMYPERYAISQPGSNYAQLMGAANGGDISSFPRRNGPIRGPGTETSDDIPAMLSDGEFVMTAQAVRGAGNGSRQKGMQQMYDMMRTFEGRAPRGN